MPRRGAWAERMVASLLRRHGCATLKNIYYYREIDVVAVCHAGGFSYKVLLVEVKSGKQVVDMDVVRRIHSIARRAGRSGGFIKFNAPARVDVEYVPVLVVGPRIGLTPRAVEYSRSHNVEIYRYQTSPGFTLVREV